MARVERGESQILEVCSLPPKPGLPEQGPLLGIYLGKEDLWFSSYLNTAC